MARSVSSSSRKGIDRRCGRFIRHSFFVETRSWDNTSQLSQEEIGHGERMLRIARDTDIELVAPIYWYLAGKLPVPQAPNGESRIVFKILKADGGTLKATLYYY